MRRCVCYCCLWWWGYVVVSGVVVAIFVDCVVRDLCGGGVVVIWVCRCFDGIGVAVVARWCCSGCFRAC